MQTHHHITGYGLGRLGINASVCSKKWVLCVFLPNNWTWKICIKFRKWWLRWIKWFNRAAWCVVFLRNQLRIIYSLFKYGWYFSHKKQNVFSCMQWTFCIFKSTERMYVRKSRKRWLYSSRVKTYDPRQAVFIDTMYQRIYFIHSGVGVT